MVRFQLHNPFESSDFNKQTMGRRKKIVEECEKIMDKPGQIRNMAIAAHIDHGKTTLSDNLLAGAGMISKELAGKQLAMDTHEDEQERGITINAANVSMTHNYKGTDYLINLIDTPGHVAAWHRFYGRRRTYFSRSFDGRYRAHYSVLRRHADQIAG